MASVCVCESIVQVLKMPPPQINTTTFKLTFKQQKQPALEKDGFISSRDPRHHIRIRAVQGHSSVR